MKNWIEIICESVTVIQTAKEKELSKYLMGDLNAKLDEKDKPFKTIAGAQRSDIYKSMMKEIGVTYQSVGLKTLGAASSIGFILPQDKDSKEILSKMGLKNGDVIIVFKELK